MATVYSKRLAQALGFPNGSSIVYTVPAGYTAVVRDIDCYTSAGVSNADLFFEGAIGNTFFRAEVVALTQDSPQWRGRQILFAGETLTVNNTSSVSWDFAISGYELAD